MQFCKVEIAAKALQWKGTSPFSKGASSFESEFVFSASSFALSSIMSKFEKVRDKNIELVHFKWNSVALYANDFVCNCVGQSKEPKRGFTVFCICVAYKKICKMVLQSILARSWVFNTKAHTHSVQSNGPFLCILVRPKYCYMYLIVLQRLES